MRLVPLGVRGSTPAPGSAFVRYGGHTSCLAVLADGADAPALLLDAGTGLRDLPPLLDGAPFRGAVVLTHLHWDHVQGLPFCPALDRPDAAVDLFVPGPWAARGTPADQRASEPADQPADELVARRLLAGGMSPPHFPIGPDGLLGRWRFRPARPGALPLPASVGGTVTVAPVQHKGGVTLGIRVDLDGASIAYLPDHAPAAGADLDPVTESLVSGVDMLWHDGQFRAEEQDRARAYGHATVEDALQLADRCRVGRLVLTHHAPDRSDEELDDLAARVRRTPQGRPVTFARQGHVYRAQPARRAETPSPVGPGST